MAHFLDTVDTWIQSSSYSLNHNKKKVHLFPIQMFTFIDECLVRNTFILVLQRSKKNKEKKNDVLKNGCGLPLIHF